MKKYFYLVTIGLCSNFVSKAAPGDTTWVQANNTELTAPANFDTTVTFPAPDVTYRKILMIFTLGKYVCPSGSTYCGSWDYLVNNYIMTPGGDTLEISRLITPYASTSTYFPDTWTHDYVYDVTDYASQLSNTATVRIAYGGYSYGFTANVRFAFIEGTPDRTVLGLQRFWHGSFEYGVAADPITNHVFTVGGTVPSGTVSPELKMRITGHGEDGNDCNEFCPNTYDVILNGSDITTQNFFRTNCGLNPVSPQTGTWPYNRSGWCPGATVTDIYNPLPGAVGTYSVNVTFPAYTTVASSSGNSTPTYDIEAVGIYYGGINKTLDASLEEILAPNDDPNYSRSNTVCGQPVIHVHNAGSTTITSMSINYGVVGGYMNNYAWTGSLAALQDTIIDLPNIGGLAGNAGLSLVQQFTATIALVNGETDNDPTNNTVISSFKQAPLWESDQFIIKMKTSGVYAYAESWQILDMNDSVVASLSGTSPETLYIDTVTLGNSCYKLVVSTPDGYGLDYGNYATGSASDNGYFDIYKITGSFITVPNYLGGDFGTDFVQYFSTALNPAGVTNQTAVAETMDVYPNPAQSVVNIDIAGVQQVNGVIQVLDALGRTVLQSPCTGLHQEMSTSGLANGVYTVVLMNQGTGNRLQSKLLILK